MMMPFTVAAHVPIVVKAWTLVVTPRPMNVGAIPSVASSHPDRATH